MTKAMIVVALLASAPVLQARVVDSSPAGFTLENQIEVPVAPKAAWRALIKDIGRWWPSDHTWSGDAANMRIKARAGGCLCERDELREVQHMQVVYVEAGKLLRMTGGLGPLQGMGLHGALDWAFEATEGGTRITLRYRVGGYSPSPLDEFATVVDHVQGLQLGGLRDYLTPAP